MDTQFMYFVILISCVQLLHCDAQYQDQKPESCCHEIDLWFAAD